MIKIESILDEKAVCYVEKSERSRVKISKKIRTPLTRIIDILKFNIIKIFKKISCGFIPSLFAFIRIYSS